MILKEVAGSLQKHFKQHVCKTIDTLLSIVWPCDDTTTLGRINNHICASINLAKISAPSPMLYQTKSPATTKIVPRQPLKSKRKHQIRPTLRLAKPSLKG